MIIEPSPAESFEVVGVDPELMYLQQSHFDIGAPATTLAGAL